MSSLPLKSKRSPWAVKKCGSSRAYMVVGSNGGGGDGTGGGGEGGGDGNGGGGDGTVGGGEGAGDVNGGGGDGAGGGGDGAGGGGEGGGGDGAGGGGEGGGRLGLAISISSVSPVPHDHPSLVEVVNMFPCLSRVMVPESSLRKNHISSFEKKTNSLL